MATVYINATVREVPPGTLLLDVITPQERLHTPCAGQGRCGKCRVLVQGEVSAPSQAERQHLSAAQLSRGVRLACCTRVLGDCVVTIARVTQTRVLGIEVERLPAPAPLFSRLGAAVDIGTTTIAACLCAPDGTLLARAGMQNPQARFGADVISRVGAALAGHDAALAQYVRTAIDELLWEMTRQAGSDPRSIDAVVITGNTAMLHLLTQTDPSCLARAPFLAAQLFGTQLTGAQLDLSCEAARVYLPRCISAFVGADTVCALAASKIAQKHDTRMLVDIGTNGEIALCSEGQILCCSTAAGPAFEGAGISMGMPGADGAVDHVTMTDGVMQAHVLGDAAPVGICGSGVVDALACLLESRQMDASGLLEDDPSVIAAPVVLTQKDVRAVQLAKSAIAAGMETLTATAGVTYAQIWELAVAGGFGSYLNAQSAGTIGLIPPQLVPRVRVLGNAALDGAARMLLDAQMRQEAQHLAQAAQTVDLATNPRFMQAYTMGMFFGDPDS